MKDAGATAATPTLPACDRRPGWKRSVLTAAILSTLFLVVYNGANWIASQRSDVGTWYYDWERVIPFVPWMIVPYMLIDLFFVAAPFLCSTVDEQRLLTRRITFAILAAGTCFLLFPLQLAVERPHVEGWLGVAFNSFRAVDLPYNLCPSLHITLRTILADIYGRHTRGPLWVASHVCFSLIGLSTLLTYQHHVVDVAGGFVLATVCFFLVRESKKPGFCETDLQRETLGCCGRQQRQFKKPGFWTTPVNANRRIGWSYAFGSAALLGAAVLFRPWGLLLVWPAAATAIVAGGYFVFGAGIFGKSNGRLPWSTRLVLAPVLLGQYLSLLYYRRRCRAWDRVTDCVWIGRVLTNDEAERAVREGVTAVVDLTVNFSEAEPFRNVRYHQLPVLDLTAPTTAQLERAVAIIAEESRRGTVYVHCKIGYSRSAAIVGAYLVARGIASDADDALRQLRRVRPSIVIRPEAETAIRDYAAGEASRLQGTETSSIVSPCRTLGFANVDVDR